MKPALKLIIDARERHVLRHPEISAIPHVVKQITVGDYALVHGTRIVAIFERKTYEDYAASFKDGRHTNKAKLIELRQQTGCRIIYIIEGKAFPRPDEYFSNIKYLNIESSIFHLMMRDGIQIWKTASTLDTAQSFVRFFRSMEKLYAGTGLESMYDGSYAGGAFDCADSAQTADPAAAEDPTAMLTAPVIKSDLDICRMMWAQIKGITVETADEFISRVSIASVLEKTPPVLLSAKGVTKRALKGIGSIDWMTCLRVLCCIPGVSAVTAKTLLQAQPVRTGHMRALAQSDMSQIAQIQLGRSTIGIARAERIIRLLHYTTAGTASTAGTNSSNSTAITAATQHTQNTQQEMFEFVIRNLVAQAMEDIRQACTIALTFLDD